MALEARPTPSLLTRLHSRFSISSYLSLGHYTTIYSDSLSPTRCPILVPPFYACLPLLRPTSVLGRRPPIVSSLSLCVPPACLLRGSSHSAPGDALELALMLLLVLCRHVIRSAWLHHPTSPLCFFSISRRVFRSALRIASLLSTVTSCASAGGPAPVSVFSCWSSHSSLVLSLGLVLLSPPSYIHSLCPVTISRLPTP